MNSSAQFRITEYVGPSIGQCEAIRPVYHSLPMCLRDASRYAAALSYARADQGGWAMTTPSFTFPVRLSETSTPGLHHLVSVVVSVGFVIRYGGTPSAAGPIFIEAA